MMLCVVGDLNVDHHQSIQLGLALHHLLLVGKLGCLRYMQKRIFKLAHDLREYCDEEFLKAQQ